MSVNNILSAALALTVGSLLVVGSAEAAPRSAKKAAAASKPVETMTWPGSSTSRQPICRPSVWRGPFA